MAVSKVEYYIIVIMLVVAVSLSLLYFGNAINSDTDIELDEESQQYISDYAGFIETSGIEEAVNETNINESKSNPLLSKIGELPVISDVVGGINFIIDKTNAVWNFISLVYNLPTFFLKSFGLPLKPFSHITNILIYGLGILVILIIVRLTK